MLSHVETFKPEALQHEAEIAAFVELIRDELITSYLEIGAKFGGSLWRIAQVLGPHSRIVAVDLPHGTIMYAQSRPSLERCAHDLRLKGHHVEIIWGNSREPTVIDAVRKYGKFDLVLIDANHTLPYLEEDWRN